MPRLAGTSCSMSCAPTSKQSATVSPPIRRRWCGGTRAPGRSRGHRGRGARRPTLAERDGPSSSPDGASLRAAAWRLVVALALALALSGSTPTSSSDPPHQCAARRRWRIPHRHRRRPGHQTVYVAGGNTNNLSMFGEASCNATTATGCGDPRKRLDPGARPHRSRRRSLQATLYVVNGRSTPSPSSTPTPATSPIKAAARPSHPRAGARRARIPRFDSVTQTVYIADTNSGMVSVLDARPATRDRRGMYPDPGFRSVGAGVFPIAVDQATNTVYVGTNQGVAVIDGTRAKGPT